MDNHTEVALETDMSMLPGITLPAGIAFSLNVTPNAARFILRGSSDAAKKASTALGLAIPLTPCDAVHGEDRAALWLGPDEWLLLDFSEQAHGLISQLIAALGDDPHSLVDVSHRQIGLSVTGANAARALSAGCPLDFHRLAFPVDMVARTIFMKTEIVVWRRAETHFHVEVGRSFADYLVRHLIEAARHAPLE